LDVSRTEDEQLEALKKWWLENGLSIVAGVVIGIVAIFGWRGWQSHQRTIAVAASSLYTETIVNIRQGNTTRAREVANQLLAEYGSSGYATFAALLLARLDVDENNDQAALEQLQWVLDNADQEGLKHLARLRMARVHLAMHQPEKALEVLDVPSQGKFTAGYEELKGDIYVQLNQIDRARTSYQLALAESDSPAGNNNIYLQLKLDDIGRSNP